MQIEDDMKEALRQAAALLAELRSGALGPQKYYELYMQASDEMSRLEVRLTHPHRIEIFINLEQIHLCSDHMNSK